MKIGGSVHSFFCKHLPECSVTVTDWTEQRTTLVGTNEDVKSNEKKTMSSFVFQDGFGIFQHFAKTSMLAGKYGFLHK